VRRQSQRGQHLIGIEIADADELHLPHAEERDAAQQVRRRHPGRHHDHHGGGPQQHAP